MASPLFNQIVDKKKQLATLRQMLGDSEALIDAYEAIAQDDPRHAQAQAELPELRETRDRIAESIFEAGG